MKKILFILTLMGMSAHSAFGAQEVGCICEDGSIQTPYCGICGFDAGTMEKTADGAACICDNGLKSQEVTCSQACALHKGWTGDFDI